MTTISTSVADRVAYMKFLHTELAGKAKPLDLKNFSGVSAASDFAFKAADADGDASLSINEFTALGKKSPSDANAQALFAAIDGDKDGKLNSQEVRASGLLSPSNIKALLGVDDLGSWVVSQADANGDGGLSYDEYVESRGRGPIKASFAGPDGQKVEVQGFGLDTIPSVFNSMDTDGDGLLSGSELGAHMEAPEGYAEYRPTGGAERTSDTLVSVNDTDGDGALSAEELARATEALTYTADDKDDLDNLISVADSNKDGKVSSEEFAALAARGRTLYSLEAWQGEADGAARVMLNQLLKSTFAQLQDGFVAPPRSDVTA